MAAADRRVGTYSGGMRRRLDLALALVHEPEVLFLDEPTTGLDPISRLTLWDEVRRLNGDGATVFLTTQYLEEADQLAGRVGIIDGGKIVAEGTPDRAQGRGRGSDAAHRRRRPGRRRARRAPCWRPFGEIVPTRPDGASRCACPAGPPPSPASCARSTRPASPATGLDLAQPTLDDVFVAKTGPPARGRDRRGGRRRARWPGEARAHPDPAPSRGGRSSGPCARLRRWCPGLFFPLVLMAIFTASFANAPGAIPGFPPVRSFLDFAIAGAILQGILIGGTTAGAAFALDIEGGFFDRLVASPVSRTAILIGRLAGGVVIAMAQTLLFLAIGIAFGVRVEGGVVGRPRAAGAGRAAVGRDQRPRGVPGPALGLGRGGAGHVPPLLRAALLLVRLLPAGDDDAAGSRWSPTSTRSPTWSRRCATR